MLLCSDYIVSVSDVPISKGAILVRGEKIVDMGDEEKMRSRYPEEQTLEFRNAALMPGLIDLNSSLEQTILRGSVRNTRFVKWIRSTTKKAAILETEDFYDSAVLGGLEALSNGVTTVADVSLGSSCQAINQLGLRGIVYRPVGAMDKRRVDYAIDMAAKDISNWQEQYACDMMSFGISPLPVYACHPEVFAKVSALARKQNLPVLINIAASAEEYNFIRYGSSSFSVKQKDSFRGYVEIPPWMPAGVSPIRYVLNWEAFDVPSVMAVHCIHLDDGDIAKLKEYDVAIAACTRFNAQLGMGVVPLNEFMRAGLRIGFGTGSSAVAESSDLLSDIRLNMLMQRAINVEEFHYTNTYLQMATLGAAKALKMDDKIGSLEIGKHADIIAVDLLGASQLSIADPVSAIVNSCSGNDVLMTMVNGKILYEKNSWHVNVDVAKNIVRVLEIRRKLKV